MSNSTAVTMATTQSASKDQTSSAQNNNPIAHDPKNMQELTAYIQTMMQTMHDRFQNMSDQLISKIDEMGTRIDDLEKNINDLMSQAEAE